MFRSLIICFTCCQFAFSVPASGRQQQKRKPRPRAHPGTHARAHDVYNVGNIQLMLTSVVIERLTHARATCAHHAHPRTHTPAHPRPRGKRRRKKKEKGEPIPRAHTHAHTCTPANPQRGGRILLYIYIDQRRRNPTQKPFA